MIVRQPKTSEDRAPIVTASVVASVCLGVGLWLAHAAMGHPMPEASAEDEVSFAGAPSEIEDAVDEGESESESESEVEIEPAVATPPAADPSPNPLPPSGERAPVGTPSIGTPSVARASVPVGTGTASRVRHGRVAYLRCDGAPQAAGPFPCPRDAVLEDTVWGAIDGALACTPALPPGQADLVVELDRTAGATAAVISTRDTFPDDAIRTDAAGVVSCLAPVLSTLTTTIAGDRIRVGFRFELR